MKIFIPRIFTLTGILICFLSGEITFSQNWDNQIENQYPADNQFYVDLDDSLVIEFEKPLESLSGNLYLYNNNNFLIESIALDGENVELTGDTLLTIKPSNFFYYHWSYNILIDEDAFGTGYPGIDVHNAWNFTPSFYLKEIMYSENMQDEYMIFFSQPDDYDPQRSTPYPLLCFTDGNSAQSYQMVNDYYEQGLIPAAVCVGIGYKSGDEAKRERDMLLCQEAENFYLFIRDELLPYVQQAYHVNADTRTYLGYSLGGSFGFYTFCRSLELNNRIFHNYVCGDPSLWDSGDDEITFTQREQTISQSVDSAGVNLFMTAASSQGNRQYVVPMMETLHQRNYKDFGLYTWIIPNSTHNSASGPSIENGILWALNDPEGVVDRGEPQDQETEEETPYIPVTKVQLDTLLDTEEKTLDMVEQCYNIQKLALFGNSFQLLYHGLDDRLLNEYAQYDFYNITGDDDYSSNIFRRLFAGYNFCNKTLAGLPYAAVDEDVRKRLIAEVKFCRALLGFYAVTIFEDFPAPENVVDFQDNYDLFLLNTDRFPVDKRESIKNQIVTDLNDAISDLPLSYTGDDKYRATKGAALALLGKHQLYEQQWQDAVDAFEQVISLGIYQLSTPAGTDSADYVNAYLCNFSSIDLKTHDTVYQAEYNSESIFEINFYDCGSDEWHDWLPGWGTQATLYTSWFGPHCWHNAAPTSEFVEQFETVTDHPAGIASDPRLYATVFQEGDCLDNRPGMEFYNTAFDPNQHALTGRNHGYGLRKYLFPLHYNPWHVWNENDDVNNWRVIRYADVLLMYAEALYHLGGSDNLNLGLAALNQVRDRAGMPTVETLSPQAIIHERDVELGAEAIRFMDLVRWSKLENPWFDLSTLDHFTVGEDEYIPANPREIELLHNRITVDNTDSVGHFIICDALNHNTFTYSLTNGDGINDADNDLFYIENDTLYCKPTADFTTKKQYTIFVKAEDNYGESRTKQITVQSALYNSIIKANKEQFKIYPNPVQHQLTIVAKNTSQADFTIFNLHGQQVKSGTFVQKYHNIRVDELAKGVYILKIANAKVCFTKRFLKL